MFLYWNKTIQPGAASGPDLGDLEEAPPLLLHVTGACFTDSVKKNSRTVVSVTSNDNEGPICVLTQGSHENQALDLVLPVDAEEQPQFKISGSSVAPISLSGYLQPATDDLEQAFSDEEELAARMGREMELDEEESPETPAKEETTRGRKRNLAEATEDSEEPPESVEPPKKKQKKKKNKKNKKKSNDEDVKEAAPSPKMTAKSKKSPKNSPKHSPKNSPKNSPAQQQNSPAGQKKKKGLVSLKGGLKYKDMRVGKGAAIRKGQTANVFYVGQLTTDKTVFDKCISGDPFNFELGNGDVIRGWDEGIVGMQVGGKRRLVVPSKMAYGNAGSPPEIPPNSNLTFTVELKSID